MLEFMRRPAIGKIYAMLKNINDACMDPPSHLRPQKHRDDRSSSSAVASSRNFNFHTKFSNFLTAKRTTPGENFQHEPINELITRGLKQPTSRGFGRRRLISHCFPFWICSDIPQFKFRFHVTNSINSINFNVAQDF